MDTKCHSHSPAWDQGGPSISVEGSALCLWDILSPQVPVTPGEPLEGFPVAATKLVMAI